MNVVEVKFNNIKQTSFFYNKFKLKIGFNVLVNTDRGLLFGEVIDIIDDTCKFSDLDLSEVVRLSSKKDYFKYKENLKDAAFALTKCKELVAKYNLPMSIIDADYNFDRSQLLFRFIADERIDFRQLAKELGSIFKTRIELRQIGIRDNAKEVGGIGPCGRLLCCSSFLNSFDSVTISMAKNQNVSLNPTKINGVCGRLLCCLKYENDVYNEYRNELPKLGSVIEYGDCEGKVVSVDVLKGKYQLQFDDKSVIEVDVNDSQE